MTDITVKGLCKAYDGREVLRDLDLAFRAGKVTGLMGPSGCGKTTLLNILLGLETADAGTVTGVPADKAAVFQEERLCEPFSAAANLRLVTGRAFKEAELYRRLEELGLSGCAGKPVRDLSGGQRRRVSIARALLAKSSLLVLDEPFKGLDEVSRVLAADVILRRSAGKTVVMVTHDRAEITLMHAVLTEMHPL